MKTLHYIPLLIILFLSACTSDEAIIPPGTDGQGNVTFLFTAGSEIKTRTVLSSSENLQHVEKVHLYIFKGTGDNATYESVRELAWPAPADVDYKTTERSYSITLAPGAYTFLAIGLDDKSGATYNLPSAIAAGSTLADAKATLAAGKTKDDIAQSELFAGWAEALDVEESGNAAVIINLWRRVAGVLGYFKNVPADVQTIRVLLYEDQNTEVPLRKPTNDNVADATDFGDRTTGTTDNRILLSIDKMANAYEDNSTPTSVSGVFKGAYVLPKQAPTNMGVTHTLTVQTLKSDGITVVKNYNVIIQSATDSSTNNNIPVAETTKFPLYANRMYSIGSKLAPVDLGDGGNDIVITVNSNWLWVGDGQDELPIL